MRLGSSLAIRITGALIAVTFVATATLLGGIYYASVKRPMDEVRAKVLSEAETLRSRQIESTCVIEQGWGPAN